KAQPWGYWIYDKGAVQMRLIAIDPEAGTRGERELWKSDCNRDCRDREGWKIADTPWDRGWATTLHWVSTTVTVDNRPSQRVALECKVFDYNVELRGWTDREPSATSRVTFVWSATAGKFVHEGTPSLTECEVHTRG